MPKSPSSTYTEQVQILTQSMINGSGRLFGGQLLQWIDIAAAVAARRHAECNVTTARIDALEFHAPAYPNDLVVLAAKLTYVGRSSMEVRVESFVERLDGKRELINTAYVTMVALGEDGRSCAVEPLAPETDEEKADFEAGRRRYLERKAAKK